MRTSSTFRPERPNPLPPQKRKEPPLDLSCPLTDDDTRRVRTLRRRPALENGFHLLVINSPWSLACPPHARGKAPLGREWQKGHSIGRLLGKPVSEADKAWAKAGANTGVLLGFGDVPVQAIDIDVEDAPTVARILDLAGRHLPAGAIIRTRENTARCALLLRCEPAALKEKVQGERGAVERLAQGQQLVVHGWHSSGARLLWHDRRAPWTVPAAELPLATEAQIGAFMAGLAGAGILGARVDHTAARQSSGSGGFSSDANTELREALAAHGGQGWPAIVALIRDVGARGTARHDTLVSITGYLVRRRWSASSIKEHLLPLVNEHFKEGDWAREVHDAVAHAEKRQREQLAAAFEDTTDDGEA